MFFTGNAYSYAYWEVLLPFLAGALIILIPFIFPVRRDSRAFKSTAMMLSVGSIFILFWYSVFIFAQLALSGHSSTVEWTWFQSGSFKLTMGVLIDQLTSVMLIVVTLVSLLVQIYTHAYMREDPGYGRFYAYLSLFTGSMLGLVVSTNLFQMYFFWELVGVCSYFLIGFWFYKPSAAYACLKAFVVNRIGDFGFLVAILMFLAATWGFWNLHAGHGLLTFADPHHVDLSGAISWAMTNHTMDMGWGIAGLSLIASLMFLGPMAKSAQMPLHVWLPDAMEGPTPISALIHAATMVAAGVYMVARAYPLWLNWENPAVPTTEGSLALAVVAVIGTFTAFMAATIALTQVDIKRALAWSTVSQLGYMFAGLGVGAYTGAIFHLFTHAFFKAMLFLCSGAVIHALHGEQDMRKMGGLTKDLKYTNACFFIGCLAISGIPPLSAFFSKDEIIGGAWNYHGLGVFGPIIAIALIFTAFLTAFYMFRMYYMTFVNEYRGEVHPHAETSVTPLTAPLIALALPSICAGWLGLSPAWLGNVSLPESPFGFYVHWGAAEVPNVPIMVTSLIAAVLGWVLAIGCYKSRTVNVHTDLAKSQPGLYEFSFNRWYWDNLYHGLAAFFLGIFDFIWTIVDRWIVDNIVNFSSRFVRTVGSLLRYSETGDGQDYALVIFACVSAIAVYAYYAEEIAAIIHKYIPIS